MIDPAHYPGIFAALDRFGAFYAELNEALASIRSGRWLEGTASGDPIRAGAVRVAHRVQQAVIRHAGLAGPRLPDGGKPVEMGYVLAGLADELLLGEPDWAGRPYWDELLLEERLYGTRIAGERLFELAALLVEANAIGQDDLVVALMQAFALGFRGRFRGRDDRGEIRRLQRLLYSLALHRPVPPGLEWAEAVPVGAALEGGTLARVPSLRPWLYGTIAAALLLLAGTHLLWRSQIGAVLTQADEIAAEQAALSPRGKGAP